MRRPVITAMSAVSLAVVGLSLRASTEGQSAALPVAASGIVTPAPPTPDAAPVPRAPAPTPAATSVLPTTPTTSRTTRQRTSVTPTAAAPATAAPRASAARRASQAPAVTPSHRPRTVTVNGTPASTRYGPVQVQITVTDGRITAAQAITYPRSDHREQEINDPAVPQLNQETLQAQSAAIDSVSGATFTSAGYQQSLQSALDTAHQS